MWKKIQSKPCIHEGMIKSWKDLIPGCAKAGKENKHIPDEQLLILLADKGEELRQLLHRQKELQQKLQTLVQGGQEDSAYARRFEIPIMPLSVKRKEEHEHFLNKKRLETSVAALRRQNSYQEKKAQEKRCETLLSDKLKQENKEKSKQKSAADKELEHWLEKRDRLKDKVRNRLADAWLEKSAALMQKMESAWSSVSALKDKSTEAYKNFRRIKFLDKKGNSEVVRKTERSRDCTSKRDTFSEYAATRNESLKPRNKSERERPKDQKAETKVPLARKTGKTEADKPGKADGASGRKRAESEPRTAENEKQRWSKPPQREKLRNEYKKEKKHSENNRSKARPEEREKRAGVRDLLTDEFVSKIHNLKKADENSGSLGSLMRMKVLSARLRKQRENEKEEIKSALQKAERLKILKEKRQEEKQWELRKELLKAKKRK